MNEVSNTQPEGIRPDVPTARAVDQVRVDVRQAVAMADLAVREAATPEGRETLAEMGALEVIRGGLGRLLAEVDALIAERDRRER